MKVLIHKSELPNLNGNIQLPLSKSILNRIHILRAVNQVDPLPPFSNEAQDSCDLRKALTLLASKNVLNPTLDAGSGGTTFRFLLAYAVLNNIPCRILVSNQLAKRPQDDLIAALLQTGNHSMERTSTCWMIKPLPVSDGALHIKIDDSISSQFASAILLATSGREVPVSLETTSTKHSGYLNMTLDLLQTCGKEISKSGSCIIMKGSIKRNRLLGIKPEADWSAAAVWYVWAALSNACDINLPGLQKKSLQPDAAIASLMHVFGVKSIENEHGIRLSKEKRKGNFSEITYSFNRYPDLYPILKSLHTISGIPASFYQTGTLPFKESNRLDAIQQLELAWNNATENDLPLQTDSCEDHRIAFAASLYASLTDVLIDGSECISKSYPDYYDDLQRMGFRLETIG